MDFNLDEMTAEELDELLAKIQAKLEELQNPPADEEREDGEEPEEGGEEAPEENPEEGDELPDDLDQLEELIDEIEGRKANIKAYAEKRSALIKRIAAGEKGNKVREFKESEERKMFGTESKEYRNAWLANLQGKDITAEERSALSNGDYAIPQETANKIWGKLELYPLLDAIDVMHIPGTVVLPVEGTVNPAAVVAMGNAATDSADALAKVSLGIYKIIKTIEITADVAAMAVPAFEEWLVDRLANKVFRKICDLVVTGTGTGTLTGLATITAMTTDYTSTGVTYGDLLNIVAELPSEYLPNAKWLVSRETFWVGMKGINSSSDVRVVNTDVGSPAAYNVLGFPVIIDDNASTDIVFGDLKEGYVLNFGKDVAIDRDESVGFRSGSTVFRGMALCDGKPTGVGIVRCEQDS